MSKSLTVFGATGNQGGSVIQSILQHVSLSKEYRLQGVTRSLENERSVALIRQGVHMVQADLNDETSVRKAIEGSDVVFGMTNYWESRSSEVEITQGKFIADACKSFGVQILFWSTLCNATSVSGGKLANVHHFESKAAVEQYIRSIDIPAVFLDPGCFMTNLKTSMLSKTSDGYTLRLPLLETTEIPMIDVASDTGKWVVASLLKKSEALGQHFVLAEGWYKVKDLCEIFSRVTGKTLKFENLSDSEYTASVGQELSESWQLLRDFEYFGPSAKKRSLEATQFLFDRPTTLEEYLRKSAPW
ncbi:NAD(P)-binding protein [Trichoderma sp. SZMC 28013]